MFLPAEPGEVSMELLALLLLVAALYGLKVMVSEPAKAVGSAVSAIVGYQKTRQEAEEIRRVHAGLCTLWQRDDWVAVDTETTGLGDTAVVVEIAVRDRNRELLMCERVALPSGRRISAKAQQIHGINSAALKNAAPWPEVRERFQAAVAGRRCLAYNAEFDERVVAQTDKAHGLVPLRLQWLDLMESYSILWGERWPDSQRIKLQKLPGAGHSAEADSLCVVALLERIANQRAPL
jgi:DNA polymerase-3 subunit epsilon